MKKLLSLLFSFTLVFYSVNTVLVHAIDVSFPIDELSVDVLDEDASELNLSLGVSPVVGTVLSGHDALYYLNFKVTGSRVSFPDAKVIVELEEGYSLVGPLSNYAMDGVIPTVDGNVVTWDLGHLESGQSHIIVLNVATANGVTPDETKISISSRFESETYSTDEPSTATVNIDAGTSLTASTTYVRTEAADGTLIFVPPMSGDFGVWNIKIDSKVKESGLLYFKEGTKIKVENRLPKNMTYVSNNGGGVYDASKHVVMFEFDAPSIAEPLAATTSLFYKEVEVKVSFESGIANNHEFTNYARANAVAVGDLDIDSTATAKVFAGTTDPTDTSGTTGDLWSLTHYGPSNGVGSTNSYYNPDPAVYDSALLKFVAKMSPSSANHPTIPFEKYEVTYKIDPNLDVILFRMPTFHYSPDASRLPDGTYVWDNHELKGTEEPQFDVYVTIDGVEHKVTVPTRTQHNTYLNELGLPEGGHVDEIRFEFTHAPAGMKGEIEFYHSVKPGYIGEVENKVYFEYEGTNKNGDTAVENTLTDGTSDELLSVRGPRHASVIDRPIGAKLVTQTRIRLDRHDSGIITPGINRVTGSFENMGSSAYVLEGDLQQTVLLPKGVVVNTARPVYNFRNEVNWDSVDSNIYGQATIVTDDYNGTGRQLVLIEYKTPVVRPSRGVAFGFDVVVTEEAASSIQIDTYGYADDHKITVPSGATALNDSYLEIDTDDMNGDGDPGEFRVLSSNQYAIIKTDSVKTTQLVKGNKDNEYSTLGHATPGGRIDYRYTLFNLGEKIVNFELFGVLPSVGDKGITDNILRGSNFTPTLVEPISLPLEWRGRTNVFYSESKNPSRDGLDSNVVYPGGTAEMVDPIDATEPNWMTESEVSDWSKIHSFKVVLDGAEWDADETFVLDLVMKAPDVVDPSLLDVTKSVNERAAWNSYAYAVNTLQVVEPARIGVVLEEPYDLVTATKSVEDKSGNGYVENLEEVKYTINIQNPAGVDQKAVKVQDQLGNFTPYYDMSDPAILSQRLVVSPSSVKAYNTLGGLVEANVQDLLNGNVYIDLPAGTRHADATVTPTDVSISFNVVAVGTIEVVNSGEDIVNVAKVTPPGMEVIEPTVMIPIKGGVRAVKSVVDADSNGYVNDGEDITYTISVYNGDVHDVLGVQLKDDLDGFNYYFDIDFTQKLVVNPAGESVHTTATGSTPATLGDLHSGRAYVDIPSATIDKDGILVPSKVDISFTLKAKPNITDLVSHGIVELIINVATVTAPGGKVIYPEVVIPVQPVVEEEVKELPVVAKDVVDASGDGYVSNGESVEYVINILNPHLTTMYDVKVQDDVLLQLSKYFVVDETALSQMLDIDSAVTHVYSPVPATLRDLNDGKLKVDLEPGVVWTIKFTLVAKDDVQQKHSSEVIENVVVITETGGEKATDKASISVKPTLKTVKSVADADANGFVNNGEDITYTISLINEDVLAVNGVKVQDELKNFSPYYAMNDATLEQLLVLSGSNKAYTSIGGTTEATVKDLIEGNVYVDVAASSVVEIKFVVKANSNVQEKYEGATVINVAKVTTPEGIVIQPSAKIDVVSKTLPKTLPKTGMLNLTYFGVVSLILLKLLKFRFKKLSK